MDRRSKTVDERLPTLREQYKAGLPARIARIVETAAAWLRNPSDSGTLADVHRMVHNLIGSSASYGFGALSETARALERELTAIVEDWTPPSQEQLERVHARVSALADERLRREGSPSPEVPVRTNLTQPSERVSLPGLPVYLWEARERFGRELAEQLAHFGYQVTSPASLTELAADIRDMPPAAIIINAGGRDSESDALGTLAEIQRDRAVPVPALLLSAQDGLEARLRAVRAGACAYLTTPVDIDELIDRLDTLTRRNAAEPYGVLIVDDSPEDAGNLAARLQEVGMLTAIVTDPMRVMDPLAELKPDLILMNLNLPGCTGLELAAVIRQQGDYAHTPVVFLAAENDPTAQREALRLTGDDCLVKPFHLEQLIPLVMSRARRSRVLRTRMIRDSLTGLFNHTAAGQQLAAEVARAQRHRRPVGFAVIDLDDFKRVNDTYGHSIGDRVLIVLSRLLQQRLRQSDIIGRIGGGKFGIIFTDTDCRTAAQMLSEIRERFACVRHGAAGRDFSITLSGGVAGYPEQRDAVSLSDAADRALQEAKLQGKNRVVLAGDGSQFTVLGSQGDTRDVLRAEN